MFSVASQIILQANGLMDMVISVTVETIISVRPFFGLAKSVVRVILRYAFS